MGKIRLSGRTFSIFRHGDLDSEQKIIKMALSAALKPTAARNLEPRSKLCLRNPFPKKKTFKSKIDNLRMN